MKKIKNILEQFRVTDLDTNQELDLEGLGELDLESLLSGDYSDGTDPNVGELDFETLAGMKLGDLADYFDGTVEDVSADKEVADDLSGFQIETPDTDNNYTQPDLALADDQFDEVQTDEQDAIKDNEEPGLPDLGEESNEEDDFQGNIRTVRGANLVYKRRGADGNFEELWIYNVGNDIKRESQIRRAILAGTDISPASEESEDGSQYADSSTVGNVQFLHITGLPQ